MIGKIFLGVAVILIYLFVRYVMIFVKLDKQLDRFPQLPGIPVFRNFFYFRTLPGLLERVIKDCATYGGIIKVNVFATMSVLLVTDLKLIEFLLSSQQTLNKNYSYSFVLGWVGRGLVSARAPKWRKTRKIVTPAFHFKLLEQYVETFSSATDILVEKLKTKVDQGPFDVYPYLSLCTLDIICESAMGVKRDAQLDSESPYVRATKRMCQIVVERSLNPFKLIHTTYKFTKTYWEERRILKIIHDYTDSVIKARRAELMSRNGKISNTKRLAFLDLILQAQIDGRPMTDEEIRMEVDTITFAGHDTSSIGLSFILYCLSLHADVQDKVYEEIVSVLGNGKNESPVIQDYQQMRYLDMVIKESLRLYPPIPVIGRSVMDGDIMYDGKILPQFTQFFIFTYCVHRNPEIYSDPEKFDPDRFLPENHAKRHPFSYLPFSAGLRNCLGLKFAMLEMKAIICSILLNFVVKPVPNYKPELLPQMVLKSSNGVMIQLEKRV